MILAVFDLQVTQMLPSKIKSTGLSVQETVQKLDFQDVSPPMGMILATFHL